MANSIKRDWTSIEEFALSFAKTWEGARSEKSEGQRFILDFLRVFGQTGNVGEFEKPVVTTDGKRGYIDFFWEDKIAIEMKSKGKRLDNAFEQLGHYMECLPEGKNPPDLWMVCDFENIHLYCPSTDQAIDFKTKKLRKYIKHFAALANYEPEPIRNEKGAVDLKATAKMNRLFEALQAHGYTGHELEVYLARLLFCLFADDTGIFTQEPFYHYILESKENGSDLAGRLGQLFQDLNEPEGSRVPNPFLTDKIKQDSFRHINGDLFKGHLRLASFDRKMRQTLLDCLDFDWSKINPAIFGSMFQGVMDAGERREIGAHYTTEENILKVINPLFMDGLKAEFKKAKKTASQKALSEFHSKLASLKFLDPACGCGNFLIIAYRELRQLELEVVKEEIRLKGSGHRLLNIETHFKVNVDQFHGIEILSWPCQIAKTGMWLMDHLMNIEASEDLGDYFARIPLETGAVIVNANAHRMDWESLVPKKELSYILGNPPFVGYANQSAEQKEDVLLTCLDENGKPIKNAGKVDYVAAWYYRASKYLKGTHIRAAFVSTNSITQGEQVAAVWKPLFDMFDMHIDFAYRTFKWDSEAKGKAAVHCVIIGFSVVSGTEKAIYDGGDRVAAKNISPYIVDAPDVFVESRKKPVCEVPEMQKGNIPVDDGNLIIEKTDIDGFLKSEPQATKYVRILLGADEYINNKERYCLWLVDADPADLRKMPQVMERIERCRQFRLSSPKAATRKCADSPTLFMEIRQPESQYLLVPRVSSEKRQYIPFGFMDSNIITTDANSTIANATHYHLGILTSSVHMAWVRAVCGRLKSDYRYSNDIVYNNFPWPDATEKQKADIERLAQSILDARALFPKSSLADLYDPLTMPRELLKAHRALDKAVMKLYGFGKDMGEPAIVAGLVQKYQALARKGN